MENLDLQRRLSEWWLQRRQMMIAVILIISALLLFFGAYRFWQSTSQLETSITRRTQELQVVEQRATLLNTITPDDRAGYELASQALPSFKQPLQVVRTIEAVSQSTGVVLGEYDLNPGVVSTESAEQSSAARSQSEIPSTERLRLEIDITGTFQQVTAAVDAIEQSMPVMEITDMRIAPSRGELAGGTSGGAYVATLQLESYYTDINSREVSRRGAQQISPGQRRVRDQLSTMTYWLETANGAEVTGSEDTGGNSNLFQLTQ